MEKLVLTDGCGQLVCAPLQLTQNDVFIIHFYQKKKKKKKKNMVSTEERQCFTRFPSALRRLATLA